MCSLIATKRIVWKEAYSHVSGPSVVYVLGIFPSTYDRKHANNTKRKKEISEFPASSTHILYELRIHYVQTWGDINE